MTPRRTRRLLVLLALVFMVAVTWPGVLAGNRFRPTVFGMPFSLVWVALWIVVGLVVLVLVDRAFHGSRTGADDGGRP